VIARLQRTFHHCPPLNRMHPSDPALLDRCRERWHLVIGPSLTGGSESSVFACSDANGTALVLKLSMAAECEAAALQLWRGRAAVRLRDWDAEVGALLLERIVPATPLPPDHEEDAMRIAAGILADLHAVPLPPDHPFPSQPAAFDRFLREARANAAPGTAGLSLLPAIRPIARELWSSARQHVLLHGDFIDKNLLLGPDGYVAIDPMPLIGDPCSDIGFFAAYHPPARRIADRARALARRLNHDPERAARWAAIYAVGEACETWRQDSDELQAWVQSGEALRLLGV